MSDTRIVMEITEISSSRVRILLDDGTGFVLYKGERRNYNLREGEQIGTEDYAEIMETVLPKRAKLRALNLLKARSYTQKALADKLRDGGYPAKILADAIAYAASFGYVDDRQYALDFVEYNKEKRSRTWIFNALQKKGVPKEIIEDAWQENASDEESELEREQILFWMRKKNFIASEATFAEKQKFCAFLYRKGFQIDAIQTALSLDIESI